MLDSNTSAPPAFSHSQPRLFPLGQIVATPGVLAAVPRPYLIGCLERHVRGHWGTVCADDSERNTEAVSLGERILSAYPINPAEPCKGHGDNCLWIITEHDRSVTTFLLPSEY